MEYVVERRVSLLEVLQSHFDMFSAIRKDMDREASRGLYYADVNLLRHETELYWRGIIIRRYYSLFREGADSCPTLR